MLQIIHIRKHRINPLKKYPPIISVMKCFPKYTRLKPIKIVNSSNFKLSEILFILFHLLKINNIIDMKLINISEISKIFLGDAITASIFADFFNK